MRTLFLILLISFFACSQTTPQDSLNVKVDIKVEGLTIYKTITFANGAKKYDNYEAPSEEEKNKYILQQINLVTNQIKVLGDRKKALEAELRNINIGIDASRQELKELEKLK